MAKGTHKGSKLANVAETWDQNERKREEAGGPEREAETSRSEEAITDNDLIRVIKEEAAEYDNENKENRLLGGQRATINDDADETASGS
jgi:hypothetical protein